MEYYRKLHTIVNRLKNEYKIDANFYVDTDNIVYYMRHEKIPHFAVEFTIKVIHIERVGIGELLDAMTKQFRKEMLRFMWLD